MGHGTAFVPFRGAKDAMETLNMPWGTMAYRDTGGEGIPVVFLHGTGCDSGDWEAVIDALPAGCRQVLMDFRGHGASALPVGEFSLEDLASDVIALTDHLGIRQAILVGHSLGGMVAMSVAARSSVVASLVLLEGWTSLRASGAFVGNRFYGTLSPSIVERIEKKSEETRGRFAASVWEAFWASVESYDAWTHIETAAVPVWEVYGEMGRTDSTFQKLRIPDNANVELRWIPNSGHYLPHERPTDVAGICREAVQRHQSGTE